METTVIKLGFKDYWSAAQFLADEGYKLYKRDFKITSSMIIQNEDIFELTIRAIKDIKVGDEDDD